MSWATWSSLTGWSAVSVYEKVTIRASLAPIPGGGFVAVRMDTIGVAVHRFQGGIWHAGYYVDGFERLGDAEKSRASIGVDASGNFHVAWTRPHTTDSYGDIVYQLREPDGHTVGKRGFSRQGFVDPLTKPLFAVAANGNAILAWHRASAAQPRYAVTVKEGGEWEADVRELFDDGSDPAVPAVAIDDAGNALVVFAQNDPKWGLVRANRYFVGGKGWETTGYRILYDDQEGGYAFSISAALSPAGEGLIGYVIRKDGLGDRVFAHTLR